MAALFYSDHTMKVYLLFCLILLVACNKSKSPAPQPAPPKRPLVQSVELDGAALTSVRYNVPTKPVLKITFSERMDISTAPAGIVLKENAGNTVPLTFSSENDQKTIIAKPSGDLNSLTKFNLQVNSEMKSTEKVAFSGTAVSTFITRIDSTDKFARISDEELLTKIQQQTFKYFWDFGHPVSGMTRERNTSAETVTTGGTGFGIMSIIVAVYRGFITRQQGLERIAKITTFLKEKCETYHGAFAHWINGSTGATVPFSAKDNGGDLVETSFLMQGLLTARQFFSSADAAETKLRNDINELWHGVEWDWYTQGQDVLYWHWSKNYQFEIGLKIKGWNESLITYVLAASSPGHSITRDVYDKGWAGNGSMKNGNTYYNVQLPLGPSLGGPLFFAHYSFLGLNPNGLDDAYANYFEQNKAHSLINYNYCKDNPKGFFGYSKDVWGLTASDDNQSGYKAHSPTNDDGVISPTAAVSSLPYTPEESMGAIRFFYYKLGDKLFKEYGFIDAFNLNDLWYSNSFLAIDQGPQIVMIENYRSGLLWDLFMSCPEVQSGLGKLGF